MRTTRFSVTPGALLCALALVGCSDHRFGYFPGLDTEGGSGSTTTATTTMTTDSPTMPTTVSPTTVSPTTVSPTTVSPTTDTSETDSVTVTTSSTTTGIMCGEAFIAGPLPLQVEASLGSQGNTFASNCGGASGTDVGLLWTAPFTGRFQIDTIGSNFDSVLSVLDGPCAGAELTCDDDSGGDLRSRLEIDLFEGQDVTIVVDSFEAIDTMVLNIAEVKVESECPDGIFETVVPFETVGQTAGAPNLRGGSCGGSESPEIEAQWRAPFDGLFRFEILEADFDPVMYLLAETCDGPEIVCNDDSDGLRPRFDVPLMAGQQVVLVVDGVFGAGEFTLLISEV